MLLASPSCVRCPPSVYVVVLLNGGGGGLCVVPCSNRVFPFILFSPPLVLSSLISSLLLSTVRVLCHSIVGLVPCLCDGVVSLRNSGDDCAGRKGVRRLLSTVDSSCVVVRVSVWCVCCLVVVCCGLWNGGVCGCVVSLLVFPFSLSSHSCLVVFGVVRAQLCEHARYPRTPLCSLVLLCSSSFSSLLAFLRAPPFLLLEWRWVIHHVLVCCVGMTATGSLSRSFSFFW